VAQVIAKSPATGPFRFWQPPRLLLAVTPGHITKLKKNWPA
jgi:hypothetical protein